MYTNMYKHFDWNFVMILNTDLNTDFEALAVGIIDMQQVYFYFFVFYFYFFYLPCMSRNFFNPVFRILSLKFPIFLYTTF